MAVDDEDEEEDKVKQRSRDSQIRKGVGQGCLDPKAAASGMARSGRGGGIQWCRWSILLSSVTPDGPSRHTGKGRYTVFFNLDPCCHLNCKNNLLDFKITNLAPYRAQKNWRLTRGTFRARGAQRQCQAREPMVWCGMSRSCPGSAPPERGSSLAAFHSTGPPPGLPHYAPTFCTP